MLKINQSNVKVLNSKFNKFTQQTVSNNRPNIQYMCSQLQRYEKQYKKFNAIELYCVKALDFAQKLEVVGLTDFAGVIYSGLIKIPNISKEAKETMILSGLKNAQRNNDSIHFLARLVDLKYLYKNENKKKYINILLEEEKCLTSIVNNYQQKASNFRTVGKDVNLQEKYKFRLAVSKVDLGKAFLRSNSDTALTKLQEAETIFIALGKAKEANFANQLISQISARRA